MPPKKQDSVKCKKSPPFKKAPLFSLSVLNKHDHFFHSFEVTLICSYPYVSWVSFFFSYRGDFIESSLDVLLHRFRFENLRSVNSHKRTLSAILNDVNELDLYLLSCEMLKYIWKMTCDKPYNLHTELL